MEEGPGRVSPPSDGLGALKSMGVGTVPPDRRALRKRCRGAAGRGHAALPIVALIVAILVVSFVRPAHTAPGAEVVLFESHGLKIFRTLAADGTPVTVLTNVDADGNPLAVPAPAGITPEGPGDGETAVGTGGESAGAGPARPVAPVPGPSGAPAAERLVRVVVNQGGDSGAVDERDVEVTSDGPGGTTVIININPPPAPAPEPEIVPVLPSYPVVTGALAGGYRYPDHLYFLGYAPGTSSPSWFGGLGLNAGNGFGLSNGAPCARGFDCMFGPTERRSLPPPHTRSMHP